MFRFKWIIASGVTSILLGAFPVAGTGLCCDNESPKQVAPSKSEAGAALVTVEKPMQDIVTSRALAAASQALVAAGVLLPAGFFLGGMVVYGGDPGLGVLLVPVGAVCLIVAAGIAVKALNQPVIEPMTSDEP